MSLVTLVVFAAKPLPPESAALSGLLSLAGGLLQTGLALLFWPIRRYAPERRALAALYDELAAAAGEPPDARQPPRASAASTQAQTALAPLATDYSIEGERYRALLSQAERARLALFALNRLRVRIGRENSNAEDNRIVERYLETAAAVLRSISGMLTGIAAAPAADELQELTALAERLRATGPQLRDARIQMDAISGQLRTASDLAGHATVAGMADFARQEVHRPWHLRLRGTFATLRANLSWNSAACRHAIRLAVCVAMGDALGRTLGLHRSYWLPMTVAIVLKPDFASTFSRGVLRWAGTFAGLITATVLFHLLPFHQASQVAAIAVFMFIMRCWGPANYGIFVAAVTGLVVLLIAMVGVSPREVMAARGFNTALGGALGLAAYWLWPTRERLRLPEMMAELLDAYRAYFHCIRESYELAPAKFAGDLDGARLDARRARSNVEASFERLSSEPETAPSELSRASAMLATSHRLIHAVMALEAGIEGSRFAPARPAFRQFADDVEATLGALAEALRGSPVTLEDLPDLREDHHALSTSGDPATQRYALVNVETDRITNSLNTLSEQIGAWPAV